MDRDVIYLDNDDEITSVVDKLKGSDFASIDLVIPKEALVLKSVVNLKLLKRQAESLGKEITVVTQDKVGKKLAEQIGIPVVDKPGDQPKEVHMAEGDEPMKAAAAGAVAGVAAAELASAAIEMKKNSQSAAVAEESDGIEFKPEASPLEKTAEVVAPIAKEPNSAKASQVQPMPGKQAKSGKWWKFGWKTWALIGGFAALAIFVLAYIFVPLATVEITLAAQKKSVDFSFTVDKTYTSVDTTAQTMPGKMVTVEATKNQEFTATGKKDAGTKASGTVTIVNSNYSTSDFTINSGARIVTAGGLVFLTNSNVTVPKYSKPPQKDGTVDVAVTATAPGEQYNVVGGTMSIPGLGSTTADIKATSATAFSGGTTKKITYVTQTDVNSAKEEMTKQIETELVSEANKKAGTDVRLIDKAYKITQVSASASPDVNGEGDKFTLTAKAKIDALVFTEADLTKLATAVLGDQIGSGKEIVDKSSLTSAAELESGDFDKGTMKVKISGEAYVATKLDEDKIKTDIAGEPNQKAVDYLKALDGVSDAKITQQFPPFLKRLPRIKSHIYLKTVLDKN